MLYRSIVNRFSKPPNEGNAPMHKLVKMIATTTAICIAFLTVTALYVIWSAEPPQSPFLYRCCGTAAVIAIVCAVMLSLCDTIARHRPVTDSDAVKNETPEL